MFAVLSTIFVNTSSHTCRRGTHLAVLHSHRILHVHAMNELAGIEASLMVVVSGHVFNVAEGGATTVEASQELQFLQSCQASAMSALAHSRICEL